jgi:alkylhydroperoxidase family enzyme
MEDAVRPRIPDINTIIPEIREVAGALVKATTSDALPSDTTALMYLRAGQIFGSTYQEIRHSTALRRAGVSEDKVGSVATWWDAPYFTDAERAALALTEAVFQPGARGQERVPEELFAEASKHYDEKGLSALTMVLGSAGFWMAVAVTIKPPPPGLEDKG